MNRSNLNALSGWLNPITGKVVRPERFVIAAKRALFGRGYKEADQPGRASPLHNYGNPSYAGYIQELYDKVSGLRELNEHCFGLGHDSMYMVPNLPMAPRGYTPLSSSELRKTYGLKDDFSDEWERDLFFALLRARHKYFTDAHTKFRNKSSSGPFYMSLDRDDKVREANFILQNQKEIFRLVNERKHDELWRKYKVAFIAICGGRLQTEALDKQREVESFLQCAYNIHDDTYPAFADKSTSGLGLPAFTKRMRARVVRGAPNAVNVLLDIYMNPYNVAADKVYADVYKHRGVDDLQRKFNRSWAKFGYEGIYDGDVAMFDRMRPQYLVKAKKEFLADLISPEFAEFWHDAQSLSLYIPASAYDIAHGHPPGHLLGDPLSMDLMRDISSATQSGLKDTSSTGKEDVTYDFLLALADVFNIRGKVKPDEYVYDVLTWSDKYKVHFYNLGDDHRIWGDPGVVKDYAKLRDEDSNSKAKKYPYIVGHEHARRFGGTLLIRDVGGPRVVFDMARYFTGTYAPERDIDHPARGIRNFTVGQHAKRVLFGENPVARAAFELQNELHSKHFGMTFDAYVASLSTGEAPFLNLMDAWYIEKPEIVHYMVDESDISSDLLDVDAVIDFNTIPRLWDFKGIFINSIDLENYNV